MKTLLSILTLLLFTFSAPLAAAEDVVDQQQQSGANDKEIYVPQPAGTLQKIKFQAKKIAEKVKEAAEEIDVQLSMGFALQAQDRKLAGLDAVHDDVASIFVNLELQYKRFFIESRPQKLLGVLGASNIGFHLVEEEKWSVDLIAGVYNNGFDEDGHEFDERDVVPELAGISRRYSDSNLGLRYSYLFEESFFTMDLMQDISGYTKGQTVEMLYSYVVPFKNWDFNVSLGYQFNSASVTDYYYGVRAHEVTALRPEYHPGASHRMQVEVAAQYPITENWVFNTGFNYSLHSNNIMKSPLTDKNDDILLVASIRYVF